MKKILRSVLSVLLVYSVALQPTLLLAQDATKEHNITPHGDLGAVEGPGPRQEGSVSAALADIAETFQRAPADWNPEAIPDTALIGPGRQVLRIFEIDPNDPSKDRMTSEHSLSDIDASLPEIPVPAPDQIEIVYNDAAKELAFVKFRYVAKLKRMVMVAAHVIKNVESPIKSGQIASRDANLLIIPLKDMTGIKLDGVRTALWPHVIELLFKAPISLDVAVPSPDLLVAGAKIVQMERISPAIAPRALVELRNLPTVKSSTLEEIRVDTVTQGDLVLTVQLDGGKVNVLVPYHEHLLPATRNNLLFQLAKAQIANPDLDTVGAFQSVLAENKEDLDRFVAAETEMLAALPKPDKDAFAQNQAQAFRAIATTLNLSNFTQLLSRDDNGRDGIQQVIDSRHFRFDADPSEDSWWSNAFASIEKAKAESNSGGWEATLRDELGPDENRMKASAALQTMTSESVSKRIFKGIVKFIPAKIQRVTSNAIKTISPKTLVLSGTIAAAGVGIDVASHLTDGAVMRQILWAISSVHETVLSKIPGEKAFAGLFEATGPFLQKNFSLVSVFAGIAVVMTFPVIAKMAAKGWARMKGLNWSAEKALFTYGINLGGYANYPYVKILWDWLAFQRNLYRALSKDIKPFRLARPFAGVPVLERIGIPWLNRGVWNNPFRAFSRSGQEEQLNRLSQVQEDEATRHQRALIIAATIVSQVGKQDKVDLDPASLIAMMNADSNGQLSTLLDQVSRGEASIELQRVAKTVAAGLSRLKDEGAGDLTPADQALVYGYLRVAKNTFSKVKGEYQLKQSEGGKLFVSSVQKLSDFMHHWAIDFPFNTALNFALFYKDGYSTYKLFKDFEIDDRNAATANTMMTVDYNFSAVLFGFADAPGFGGVFRMDPVSMFRIPAEQIEQTGIWTVVGGVDAVVTNPSTASLTNISVPLSSILLATDKPMLEHANTGIWRDHWTYDSSTLENYGYGQELSTGQVIGGILKDQVNPDSKRGAFDTQAKKMQAAIQGFQMRFLLGIVPRALAFAGIATISVLTAAAIDPATRQALQEGLQPTIDWVMGQGISNPDAAFHWAQGIHSIQATPFKQANVLLNKMAILIPSLAIGYAVCWGPAMYLMNVNKDIAAANRAKLGEIDAKVEEGLRLSEMPLLNEGFVELLKLYRSSPRAYGRIPTELRNKAEAAYAQIISDKLAIDTESIREFFEYRKTHPPIPTVHSEKFNFWVNFGGAVVSTLLFVNLSRNMYNPNLEILPQLRNAAISFAATWTGVLALNKISRGTLRLIRQPEARRAVLSNAKIVAGAAISVATEEGRSALSRGIGALGCMLGLKQVKPTASK